MKLGMKKVDETGDETYNGDETGDETGHEPDNGGENWRALGLKVSALVWRPKFKINFPHRTV
jgi:hypothetical protein